MNCPWCNASFEPKTVNQRFCSDKPCKKKHEHGRGFWAIAHERKGHVGVKAYKRALASAGGQEQG